MSLNDVFASDVIRAIRSVVGFGSVSLQEPSFQGNELLYIKECIDSSYVSSVGKFVDRFEFELAKYCGSKHAIAVINGTSALHIALILAGVKAGDEVLMPALTFVATANAVSYCQARPHFVDSDNLSLGIDVHKLSVYLKNHTRQKSGKCINLRTGNVISAMIPVHIFGHMTCMDKLLEVSEEFNIPVVEDAAESLGSRYLEKHSGTFGLLGTVSFNGNKIITTGGGGAILTNDTVLAKYAKHLTTTAKLPHAWNFFHNEVGYNYRMPNLNAALGCAQLEQLDSKLSAKRKLFERYQIAFKDIAGVKLIKEPKNCISNYWLQTIMISSEIELNLELILQSINNAGIMTRPAWTLIHELPPYQACQRMDLTNAQYLQRSIINIPSSPDLAN